MTGAEKINEILKLVDLKPAAFARAIGLKAPQNVYDIQKGKVDISKDVALKIASVFPQFEMRWLLTGEGEMVKGGEELESKAPGATNRFTGMTDDQINEFIADRLSDHLREMYEEGRAYPKELVMQMMREKDNKIEELQRKNAILEVEKEQKENTRIH